MYRFHWYWPCIYFVLDQYNISLYCTPLLKAGQIIWFKKLCKVAQQQPSFAWITALYLESICIFRSHRALSELLQRHKRFICNGVEIWPGISGQRRANIWIMDGVQHRSRWLLSAFCSSGGRDASKSDTQLAPVGAESQLWSTRGFLSSAVTQTERRWESS